MMGSIEDFQVIIAINLAKIWYLQGSGIKKYLYWHIMEWSNQFNGRIAELGVRLQPSVPLLNIIKGNFRPKTFQLNRFDCS